MIFNEMLYMEQKFKLLIITALLLWMNQSCKKVCDFPKEDLYTGDIVLDANVLGYNSGGTKLVRYTEDLNNPIVVSFDKGYTYVPVDYSKYTVMNFPVSVGCNTHFEKDVTINTATSKVTYTLEINACPDCEEQYRQDNWVLVPKFSTNFQVVYSKK